MINEELFEIQQDMEDVEERLKLPIQTVHPKFALPNEQGKIYWHINDLDPNWKSKHKLILAIEQAFKILSKYFYPLQFESTKDSKLAPIRIFIKKRNDKSLPEKFEKGVLAYAYLPQGKPMGYQSDIYLNADIPWSDMHKAHHISLRKVFVHECLHSLGLYHSANKKDVMYYMYQPNNSIWLSPDTVAGIDKLYGKYKDNFRSKESKDKSSIPKDTVDSQLSSNSAKDILVFLKSLFFKKSQIYRLTPEQQKVIADNINVRLIRGVSFRRNAELIWQAIKE